MSEFNSMPFVDAFSEEECNSEHDTLSEPDFENREEVDDAGHLDAENSSVSEEECNSEYDALSEPDFESREEEQVTFSTISQITYA